VLNGHGYLKPQGAGTDEYGSTGEWSAGEDKKSEEKFASVPLHLPWISPELTQDWVGGEKPESVPNCMSYGTATQYHIAKFFFQF
jgi:hypothetical protein